MEFGIDKKELTPTLVMGDHPENVIEQYCRVVICLIRSK